MTDSSEDYFLKKLGFSIETLTEDIKPVSTEQKFESRNESIILAHFGSFWDRTCS